MKLIKEVNKTSTVFIGVFVERELKFLRAPVVRQLWANTADAEVDKSL